MKMPWNKNNNIEILKHSPGSDVYMDGRYLVVNMRISLKSDRGRSIAGETAAEIKQAIIDAHDSTA